MWGHQKVLTTRLPYLLWMLGVFGWDRTIWIARLHLGSLYEPLCYLGFAWIGCCGFLQWWPIVPIPACPMGIWKADGWSAYQLQESRKQMEAPIHIPISWHDAAKASHRGFRASTVFCHMFRYPIRRNVFSIIARMSWQPRRQYIHKYMYKYICIDFVYRGCDATSWHPRSRKALVELQRYPSDIHNMP